MARAQQQQQPRARRKREAFEYVSSDEEAEEIGVQEEKGQDGVRRNVQPRLSAAQQHAHRHGSSRSRSPSASRGGLGSASASSAQQHAAAAAPSIAAPAAPSRSTSLTLAPQSSSGRATPGPSPSPSPASVASGAQLQPHDPSLFGCRSVSAYRRLNTIDEGSYGVVHRAEEIASGQQVALKKIKLEKEHMAAGFPITALREINILRALRHPNIVGLKEIVTAKAGKTAAGAAVGAEHSIYMVMEYCHHDLKALMLRMGASQEDKLPGAPEKASSTASTDGAPTQAVPAAFPPFRVPEVKNLLRQLLSGVAYLHRHWVLHRDLKTSNLLYSNEGGRLLICDFGLARRYGDPLGNYTPLVVTLWYRAPELLWGAKTYSSAVDMWSVGCIFAELLLNRPLLAGQSEMEQLSKMIRLMGTPSLEDWPEFGELEHARNYSFARGAQPSRLRELFPRHSYTASGNALSELGFDLLQGLLTYNPAKRLTAAQALAHPYFAEAPLPQSAALMPTFPASNEKSAEAHAHGPDSGDLRRKREQESMGFFL